MRVEILQRRRVFDDFLKIDEARLRFQKFNGDMSAEEKRLRLMRGDALAAVINHAGREEYFTGSPIPFPNHGLREPAGYWSWFARIC